MSKARVENEWMDRAECARRFDDGSPVYDPELFFPIGQDKNCLDQVAEALMVCSHCPVLAECRDWVLGQGPRFSGVAGGMSETEAGNIRSARRLARLAECV